jgi:hypothetical protein
MSTLRESGCIPVLFLDGNGQIKGEAVRSHIVKLALAEWKIERWWRYVSSAPCTDPMTSRLSLQSIAEHGRAPS